MIPEREEYERWIQQYLEPRFPELVKEFRACLDGYERIKPNNRVDKRSLNAILHAAYSSRTPLFDQEDIDTKAIQVIISEIRKNPYG